MKIVGISAKHPSRRVSNSEVVKILENKSRKGFDGDLNEILGEVKDNLDSSGISNRYWFNQDEPWYSLVEDSIDDALSQAKLDKEEIDFVIYGSVFRRVLEPGMSTLISSAYGLHNAECMDLIEACAGWLRSMQVAQNFLKGGGYKNILVLNVEAGVHEGEYGHETFSIGKKEDLEWAYPILTLGEAVSATVVTQGGDDLFFDWASYPQFANLCTLALPDVTPAGNVLGSIQIDGEHGKKFRCYSGKMNQVGFKRTYKLIAKNMERLFASDAIVTHSHSHLPFKRAMDMLGNKKPLLNVYKEYGNVASCSFPLAIIDAQKKGMLSRGQQVSFVMGAAGLSLGFMSLKY